MGSMKLKKFHDKCVEELEGMYKEGAPLESAKIPVMKDLAKLTYYLGKICEDCEMEEGYSQTGNSYDSYRGRARDSMGRYSGTPYSGRNVPSMSYDEARDVMTHRLGDLMMCTNDQFVQSVLSDALNRIQNH